MATFVFIPGAGSGPWYWHLVEDGLRRLGHDTVAVELPSDDDSAGFPEYADAAEAAIGDRGELAIVAHSHGWVHRHAARRSGTRRVAHPGDGDDSPRSGESPGEWWSNTGHDRAFRAQATLDGIPPDQDPSEAHTYYQGVPEELVAGAEADVRGQSGTPFGAPWPLDAWPDVPTRFVLCTEDRFVPASFMRQVIADRLAPDTPVDELPAGHMPMLSHPVELATILDHAWVDRKS